MTTNGEKILKISDCLLPFRLKAREIKLENCIDNNWIQLDIDSSILLKDYLYQYDLSYKSNIVISRQKDHIYCSTEVASILQFANAFAQYELSLERNEKNDGQKINVDDIIPLTAQCSYHIITSAKYFVSILSLFAKYYMSFYPHMWETIYIALNNDPILSPYMTNIKQYFNNESEVFFTYNKKIYVDKGKKLDCVNVNNSLFFPRFVQEEVYEKLTLMKNIKVFGFNDFMYEIIDNPWYPSINRQRDFKVFINASDKDLEKIDKFILEYKNIKL